MLALSGGNGASQRYREGERVRTNRTPDFLTMLRCHAAAKDLWMRNSTSNAEKLRQSSASDPSRRKKGWLPLLPMPAGRLKKVFCRLKMALDRMKVVICHLKMAFVQI
jgi:hypothetical protein